MVKTELVNELDANLLPLKPQNCPYCGKIHKKITVGRYSAFVPDCECLNDKITEKANRAIKRAKQQDLVNRYKNANFPYDTRGQRFKRLKSENKAQARDYVKNFVPKKRKGLFLLGNVGNGKTTFAVCVGKELLLKGYKVKFLSFSHAIRLIQSSYGKDNPLSFIEQVAELAKNDLVIFDDFGRETYKDRTLTDVADLINHLYTEKTNVIITSNPEMLNKIKKIPDFAAMLDRFSEMTETLTFLNESYRKKKNKQQEENK